MSKASKRDSKVSRTSKGNTIRKGLANFVGKMKTKAKTEDLAWMECTTGCDFTFLQNSLNLKHRGNIEDFYKVDAKKLGAGTFGYVSKATHKGNGMRRAVKIIVKNETKPEEHSKLENEMFILQKLSHPNILQLIEYFETPKKVYIVTDVYEGGELFDEITKRKEFTEADAAIVIKQLLSCIAYMNEKKIVHRDIKPENIMLEKSKSLKTIKLIDFGHAVEFNPKKNKLMREKVGTPYYIAPEVLRKQYDHRCDIWSIGVITFILLCGYPPFNGRDNAAIFKRIQKGHVKMGKEPWPSVSVEAKEFVRMLLKFEFRDRVTAREALKHQFFTEAELTKTKYKRDRASSNGSIGGMVAQRSRSVSNAAKGTMGRILRTAKRSKNSERKQVAKAIRNLKRFKCKDRFVQIVYSYVIAQCLPKTKRENLANIFKKWDTNNDGLLSRDELIAAMKSHASKFAALANIDRLFELMDTDGSGFIEYQEFLVAVTDPKTVMNPDNLSSVFDLFDKNGDGYITIDELRDSIQDEDMMDDVLEDMLRTENQEKPGCMTKEEFIRVMTSS